MGTLWSLTAEEGMRKGFRISNSQQGISNDQEKALTPETSLGYRHLKEFWDTVTLIDQGRMCVGHTFGRGPDTWILDIPCWLLDIERGRGGGKKNQ